MFLFIYHFRVIMGQFNLFIIFLYNKMILLFFKINNHFIMV
jgi:hypothetical protein